MGMEVAGVGTAREKKARETPCRENAGALLVLSRLAKRVTDKTTEKLLPNTGNRGRV
jgi:hypothetical protein